VFGQWPLFLLQLALVIAQGVANDAGEAFGQVIDLLVEAIESLVEPIYLSYQSLHVDAAPLFPLPLRERWSGAKRRTGEGKVR
jgi:hypothetical protein